MNIGFMQGRLIKSEKRNVLQCFPWKNWMKEFSIAKKYKIKLMEWTIDYFKFNENPLINKKKINMIIKLQKKNMLKINSVTCDFYMHKPYTKAKSNYQKKRIFNNFVQLIDSCKKIGVKNIVIPLVDNSSLNNYREEKESINFFLIFNKILKKNKIRMLFEIDYNPKKVYKFINHFGDYYGINYDSGNSASLGFKIKDEAIYFNRVHNIHIKDRKYKGKSVKLGDGDCNFRELFIFLKKINYNKNLILQTEKTWKKNEIGEILDNIKFIKNFIK